MSTHIAGAVCGVCVGAAVLIGWPNMHIVRQLAVMLFLVTGIITAAWYLP